MDPLEKAPDERFEIQNRSDLVAYLVKLAERTERFPERVENPTSAAMIEAVAAWMHDTDGRLPSRNIALDDLNPWQIAAILFSVGLIYE